MSQEKKYTKPGMRERIKDRIMAGSKGGKPGQWSARKAQLLAQEYKKAGGGYKGGKGEKQKSLEKWGKEKWMTKDEYEKRKKAKSAAKKYKDSKWWNYFRFSGIGGGPSFAPSAHPLTNFGRAVVMEMPDKSFTYPINIQQQWKFHLNRWQ